MPRVHVTLQIEDFKDEVQDRLTGVKKPIIRYKQLTLGDVNPKHMDIIGKAHVVDYYHKDLFKIEFKRISHFSTKPYPVPK